MLLICVLLGASAAPASAASGAPASSSAPAAGRSPSASASAAASGPLDAPAANDPDFRPPVKARDWNWIVLHHSATTEGDVASIDAVHRLQKDSAGKPWLGIGYHFVVGNGHKMGDGEIRPTFRWQRQLPGAHAGRREYNERGIGICMIGNFEQNAPTPKQLAATGALVATLAQRHEIGRERIVRHLDVHSTACPGRLFPWDTFLDGLPQAARLSPRRLGERSCAATGPLELANPLLTIRTRH